MNIGLTLRFCGNDSNLLIVFYVQIMPDDFVMQLGVSLEIGNFCTLSALFNQSWFVRVDFASVAIAFKLSLLQYRI